MSQPPNKNLESFDANSSIFQYSPGIAEVAQRLFDLSRQIMLLQAERAALEKELLEFCGASTSDAYLKVSLLSTMLRRDLGLDPTHPAMKIANGVTESLDAVHIKVESFCLPQEGERH